MNEFHAKKKSTTEKEESGILEIEKNKMLYGVTWRKINEIIEKREVLERNSKGREREDQKYSY